MPGFIPKTRIICTIGPASRNETVLRKMMLAGMDVARLNFSHGTHDEHEAAIGLIRRLNVKYRRRLRILQDLEGYRVRIGKFKDKHPIQLKKKQVLFLTNKDVLAEKNIVAFDYAGPLGDIKTGSFIYIDDGNIVLLVKGRTAGYLKCEVAVPGALKEHKGMNMPELRLRFKGLTNKDLRDALFGIQMKVDYVAQSFVRDRNDMIHLRDLIKEGSPECRIIAKIENRQGIKNIDGILDVSDGIMVARGDMGVSLPVYEVPMIQKMIIKKCRQRKKFVITATQMLESMTENLRPTRAEVADVANAVLDGSDFTMLSAETAAGKYPVEAVAMMNQVIRFTEQAKGKI